jgi:hypothetical protein
MKRLYPITAVFLALAGAWAMAQFVLAFFVHVAERARPTSDGWVVPPTRTYMQADALSEVVLTAVVLGMVLLVASQLHRRRRDGAFGAGRLAWGVSVATLFLGIVGFSYLFGVSVFLCLACASAGRRLPAEPRALTGTKAASLG